MKLALVTGAYKGLGFEWCRQLAKDSYRVILTARTLDKAEDAANKLVEENLAVIPQELDVAREESIIKLFNWVKKEFATLDVLINNAGINSKDDPNEDVFEKSFKLSHLDPEEVLRHIRINSISPIIMVKHFRDIMIHSLEPKVISISSWLGSITDKDSGGHYSYTTSKFALNMMNKAMALEIIDEDITCVTLNPGWVKTDMGGDNALLTPRESVRTSIENVLKKITIEDTGKFFNYDGTEHPW